MSSSEGYTFIEMLIVLSIIALMALIAVPWFVKLAQRNQMKSAAREIHSTMLAARMKAVKRNLNHSVLVLTAVPGSEDRHTLEVQPEEVPPAPTPSPTPARYFVANKNVEFVALPAGGKVTFGGDGRMVTPAAASDVTFRGVSGATALNQITIRTHPSGRVEVITPVAWQ